MNSRFIGCVPNVSAFQLHTLGYRIFFCVCVNTSIHTHSLSPARAFKHINSWCPKCTKNSDAFLYFIINEGFFLYKYPIIVLSGINGTVKLSTIYSRFNHICPFLYALFHKALVLPENVLLCIGFHMAAH